MSSAGDEVAVFSRWHKDTYASCPLKLICKRIVGLFCATAFTAKEPWYF
jgi:hypothetical protein